MASPTSFSMGGLAFEQTPDEIFQLYSSREAAPSVSDANAQPAPPDPQPGPTSEEAEPSPQGAERTVFNTSDPRLELLMDSKPRVVYDFSRLLSCRAHLPPEGSEYSRMFNDPGITITKIAVGARSTDWEIRRYSARHFLFRSIGLRVVPFTRDFFAGVDPEEQKEICSDVVEVLLLALCDTATTAVKENRWAPERAELVARRVSHFLASTCEGGNPSYSNTLYDVFCDEVRSQLSGSFFKGTTQFEALGTLISRARWTHPTVPSVTKQAGDAPDDEDPGNEPAPGWFDWVSEAGRMIGDFHERITSEFGSWASSICDSFVSAIVQNVLLGKVSKAFSDNFDHIVNVLVNVMRGFFLLLTGASWTHVLIACGTDTVVGLTLMKIKDLTVFLHKCVWSNKRTRQAGEDEEEDLGLIARALTWLGASIRLVTSSVTGGIETAWSAFVSDYKVVSGLWKTCKEIWDWFGDVREVCLSYILDARSFVDRLAARYPATARCIAVANNVMAQSHMTTTLAREFSVPRAFAHSEALTVPKSIRKNYDDWSAVIKKAEERLKNKGADYESDPVLIIMRSTIPGIGKTCLTDTLTEVCRGYFNQRMRSSLARGEMLNTVENDDKFNSNYHGEPFLRIDDFCQMIPQTSDDFKTPAFTMINTMGSRGTRPTAKMPEAQDKGRPMVVHGLFWTTNIEYEYLIRLMRVHVASVQSFCDRFTLILDVRLADPWQQEFDDNGGVLTADMIARSNYMCWEFPVYTTAGEGANVHIVPKLGPDGKPAILNIHHIIELLMMQIDETADRRDGLDQPMQLPTYVPQATPLIVSGLRTAPSRMRKDLGIQLAARRGKNAKKKEARKKVDQASVACSIPELRIPYGRGGPSDPEDWIGWDDEDNAPWLYDYPDEGGSDTAAVRIPIEDCVRCSFDDLADVVHTLVPKEKLESVAEIAEYLLGINTETHKAVVQLTAGDRYTRSYRVKIGSLNRVPPPPSPSSSDSGSTSSDEGEEFVESECAIEDDYSFSVIEEIRERSAGGVDYALLAARPSSEDDAGGIQIVLEDGQVVSWAIAQRFLRKDQALNSTRLSVRGDRPISARTRADGSQYPVDLTPIADPSETGTFGTLGSRLDKANSGWGSWFARRRARLAAAAGRERLTALSNEGDLLSLGLHMATVATNIIHEAVDGDALLAYYMREELLRHIWTVRQALDQQTLAKINVITHASFWEVTCVSATAALRASGPPANGERYMTTVWYATLAVAAMGALAWVAYRYIKRRSVARQGKILDWKDLNIGPSGNWCDALEDDPRHIDARELLADAMEHERFLREREQDTAQYDALAAKRARRARHNAKKKANGLNRKRQACGVPESIVAENPLVARYVKSVYGLGEGAPEFDAAVHRSVGLVNSIRHNGSATSCQFTAVNAYQFLTVSHLFDQPAKLLQLVYPSGYNASCANFHIEHGPMGYDVCLVSLGPGVPPLPVPSQVHRWALDGVPALFRRVKMHGGFLQGDSGALVAKNFDIDGEIHHVVDMGGEFSDCGAPYYSLEPQGGSFFGIHNGVLNHDLGHGTKAGMATVTPVPAWLLDTLIEKSPKRSNVVPVIKHCTTDGKLQFARLAGPGRTTGATSKFVPSPLPWPGNKQLAKLEKGPWGDPWAVAFDKLRAVTDPHDHGQYEWMNVRAREHLAAFNERYAGLLENIPWHGVVSYGEVGSSRSAGWPYATKGDFLETGEMSQHGLQLCQLAESALLAGLEWGFFSSNSLKDEKVSAEKAAIGKTRVFYVMDAVHFFLSRRYLGAWSTAYKASGDILRHCLGVRPCEYGSIARAIDGDNPERVFGAEDVAGMDHEERCALVKALVHSCCVTYGNECPTYSTFYGMLTPENYVRAVLFEAQFCAVQILPPSARDAAMGCNVLLGQHVNKSGAFTTTEVNDTAADAFNREICGSTIKSAKWVHYSDDTVISLLESESQEWLRAVAEFRERTGIRLTGSDKQGVVLGPLTDADILSRRFTLVNGVMCGVLSADVPNDIMRFYRKNAFVENFPAQALSACVELAPHGAQKYGVFAELLARYGMRAPSHAESLAWFNTWGGTLDLPDEYTPASDALARMRMELVRSGWDNTGRPSDARAGKLEIVYRSDNVTRQSAMDNATTSSEPTGAPITHADITTYVDETGSDFPVNSATRRGFEPGGLVEINKHTIDTVLSRPITVAETTWVSGTAAETRIQSITLLEDYFAAHANALTKLQGFGYLRADAHIKVLVNAPPTAYGMLAVIAMPQIPIVPDASDLSLSWYTGFPHVFLDLGDPNHTAEIDVPYVNFRMWSDVDQLFIGGFDSDEAQAYFDHAVIAVVVVSPLDSETAAVEVAVQCGLYNIELKEPIPPRDLPAPSARVNSRRRTAKVTRQADEGGLFMKTVRTTTGVARDVAGASHAVAGAIAGGLGASVSPDYSPVVRVDNLGITDTIAHVAGQDLSVALAPTREARVLAPQGLFGLPSDEMDISKFAQREAIFTRTTWQTNNIKGDIIGAYPVDPAHLWRLADPSAGLPYRHKTIPLSYAALMFAVYRGGITFSLRAVKNSFFSGRLSLCFFPFDRTVRTGPLTDEEVRSVHNAIVDLSQHSKTDFTCPYVNNAPWAPVIPTANVPGSGLFTNPRPLGYFYIVVQQPLTVSSAVGATSLEIIVSKRGAPDIEFGSIRGQAIPCFAGQTAASLTRTVQVFAGPEPVEEAHGVRGKLLKKKKKERLESESYDEAYMEELAQRLRDGARSSSITRHAGPTHVYDPFVLPGASGPSAPPPTPPPRPRTPSITRQSGVYQAPTAVEVAPGKTAAPKYPLGPLCLSEAIASWRDVAHRFTLINSTIATNYGGVAALENGPASTIYYVRMAYAYMTGSLRAMAAAFTGAVQVGFIPLCDPALVTEDINAPVSRTAFYANGATTVQTFVRIPWCEQYPFLPTGQGSNGAPTTTGVPSPRFGSFYNGSGSTSALVAAGDDWHCGFPIGTPPVALVTTNGVTTDNYRYQVNPFA